MLTSAFKGPEYAVRRIVDLANVAICVHLLSPVS